MITFEDARQGMAKLRDNSVNMIFTDPPYISECIGLYEDLAREAKRVLKPGGYCFAYCGAQFLPQIMQYMGTYLDWFWLFEIKHNHGWPRMFNKKLMVMSKPVVVYTKGKPERLEWLVNLYDGDERSKQYHKWGQGSNFPRKIISKLTNEGDVILDPFVGGGTTAKVCKELNREFIGFEINLELKPIVDSRMAQECLSIFC
jgi:DNA modification methylase